MPKSDEIQTYHWTENGMRGDCITSFSQSWVTNVSHLADKATALEAQAEEHRLSLDEKDEEFQDTYKALRQSRTAATERLRADLTALRGELEKAEAFRKGHTVGTAMMQGEPALIVKSYRKKPIEVEAIQYDGNNGWVIARWSGRAVIGSPVLEPTDDNPTGSYLQITTLEGVMTAIVGDWIIKGAVGEFYPCKPDAFEATFEAGSTND